MNPSALLIFDADCGLCTRFAASGLVRSANVTPIGYQSLERIPALSRIGRDAGIDFRAFTKAMALVEGDRVWIGARAFNAILRRSGGWRAIGAAALSTPLVFALENLTYRAIAAHRRRLSSWLGASACSVHDRSSLDSSGGFPS